MATFKAILGSTLNPNPRKDGTFTIFIRVYEDKVRYIKSGYSVKEKDWNPNPKYSNNGILQYVRKSHPGHKLMNQTLHKKIEEMKKMVEDLPVNTSSNIKSIITGQEKKNSFIDFFEKRLDSFKADPNAFRKWKRYNSVLNNLKGFLGEKDLKFGELNHEFVDAYRDYRIKKGRDVTTDFKKLSAILNEAIRREKFRGHNVFTLEGRPLLNKKKSKQALTQAELERIKTLTLPEGSLIWHARNIFVLNFFFHGIRIGDSLLLKPSNIQDGRVSYIMDKNSKFVSIKIPIDAYQFLDYYLHSAENPDHYLFPFLSNELDYTDRIVLDKQIESKTALVNKYLKKIAVKAEINKNITTHVARHTFASLARDKIKDISTIQKFLRHSNLRETEIYLSELTDKSLDEASDQIFDNNG